MEEKIISKNEILRGRTEGKRLFVKKTDLDQDLLNQKEPSKTLDENELNQKILIKMDTIEILQTTRKKYFIMP
jgi:hypothetical protein